MLLHGLDADVELLGDFAVFQSGLPAQQEDTPALLGELRHAVIDLVPELRKVKLILATVGYQTADISVKRIESAGSVAVRLAAAEEIDAPVAYGRHQIGQHRTREVDLLTPLPQHQEDVLHDILGEFSVVDQPESPDAQRFVMHQKELPEIGRMSIQVLHFFNPGDPGNRSSPNPFPNIVIFPKKTQHPGDCVSMTS